VTANQLAYASNVETNRHNVANEEELKRHNEATEYYAGQQLDLDKRKQAATEAYQKRELDLKEQYNQWYEKYQTATTDEKLKIEKELNRINDMRAQNDKDYQESQVQIAQEKNTLTEGANAEIKRHNEAMETVSTYEALIRERNVEYQNTFWRETINQETVKNALEMFKMDIENALLPFKQWDLFTKGEKQQNDAFTLGKPIPYSLRWMSSESGKKASDILQSSGFGK
jgi:hypothetical protein